ncbi:MAG: hypothetical protein KDA89_17900, partial [Planctomycetaceae bacterium]|nr:hypothetical protein [Planctomycetaceae bacterium]
MNRDATSIGVAVGRTILESECGIDGGLSIRKPQDAPTNGFGVNIATEFLSGFTNNCLPRVSDICNPTLRIDPDFGLGNRS